MIYARYAPSSVYPENILCVHHAVVRGAVIDATANSPRVRLHDSVFELHRRDPGLDGALYLQLPLDPCDLFIPTFQRATFLPSDHWLYLRSMNNGAAERIARLAGLDDPQAMEFWVDRCLTYDDDLPPWLLGDFVNVRHHQHIPQQLRTNFRVGDGMEDGPNEPAIEPGGAFTGGIPQGMLVTSLYLHANLPRIDLSMAGTGHAPPPRDVADSSVLGPTSGDTRWWQRAQATLDMGASRPFMSLSFAKRLGFINDSLDTQSEGTVTELSFRPGGWHRLSVYEHRTRYWGLGTLPVSIDLAAPGEDDRIADVVFMVFDDSCLPAHSSVKVVLHSAFALQLQEWTKEALAADGVSLSFSQNLSPDPYFTVTGIPEGGHDNSAAPPPWPSEMSDAPTDLLGHWDATGQDSARHLMTPRLPSVPKHLPCLFDPNHPLHSHLTRLDPPLGSAERLAMTATVPELWLDGHNQERPPAPPGPNGESVWWFGHAGVILWFMDDNFDQHIVGNDPPGEGPAAWSGECL